MGGGSDELNTQEIPLMSPKQQQVMNQLLSGGMSALRGLQLGQAYGGPVASSWQPRPFVGSPAGGDGGLRSIPDLMGGLFGSRMRQGPGRRPGGAAGAGIQENANLLANLLAGPTVNPMTQGMTGNMPGRSRMA